MILVAACGSAHGSGRDQRLTAGKGSSPQAAKLGTEDGVRIFPRSLLSFPGSVGCSGPSGAWGGVARTFLGNLRGLYAISREAA